MDLYKSIAKHTIQGYESSWQQSLQLLESAKKESYYDKNRDELNRKAYYKNIQVETPGGKEMYQPLSLLLKKTHTTQLSYDDARHKHLYTRVDLHPNNMLKSIYTGEEYEPEKIIAADLRIARELVERATQQFSSRSGMNEDAFAEHLASLVADGTYNAEHTVPQSWFAKRYPMKADLHHLFTCELTCNEFRGNIPFFNFNDFDDMVMPGCGKKDGNKFEPSEGKGAVARATLYFLLRYPGEINNNAQEYTKERIQMLLQWHKEHPVSSYELHRNAEIFKVQGNRNPLVDHPEWSTRINFILGLK